MRRSLLLGLLSLTLAGCSVIGMRSGYEQPEYEVIDRIGDNVKIRRYAPRVAAGVEVEAFRILAPSSRASITNFRRRSITDSSDHGIAQLAC